MLSDAGAQPEAHGSSPAWQRSRYAVIRPHGDPSDHAELGSKVEILGFLGFALQQNVFFKVRVERTRCAGRHAAKRS